MHRIVTMCVTAVSTSPSRGKVMGAALTYKEVFGDEVVLKVHHFLHTQASACTRRGVPTNDPRVTGHRWLL